MGYCAKLIERMRNSAILIINMAGLATEVTKNIVLAGIGSLTILDSHTVEADDLGAQFFLEATDIGSNRGEASKIRIQRLNPRVAIETVDKEVGDLDTDWFASYDIVVATELTYDQLIKINSATRKSGRAFYAAGLFGLSGFVFADLVEHRFKIIREQTTSHTTIGPETATRSVVDIQTVKNGNMFQETITKVEKYKSLEEMLNNVEDETTPSFGQQFRARKLLKISPILPALFASWKSTKITKESVLNWARILGLPAGIITEEFLSSFIKWQNTELSPTAAVIGGVLAQDILNVLSLKEQPIQNLFLLDGSTGEGPIYTV